LALLALAMQLALAFGHIHLKDALGETHSTASAETSALASLSDEQPTQPADGSHHEHEDEYCAIYAINSLIASAQHAEPPALLLPLRTCHARHAPGYEAPLAALHHVLFQARAPPIV
jgi:hypothetical protein